MKSNLVEERERVVRLSERHRKPMLMLSATVSESLEQAGRAEEIRKYQRAISATWSFVVAVND